MAELPPAYWADVNKLCSELLDNVPPERQSLRFVLYAVIWKAEWPAEAADTTATLERMTYEEGILLLSLGGLRKTTSHTLHLRSPVSGTTTARDYRLLFDPQKEVIMDARSTTERRIPYEMSLRDRWQYSRGHRRTEKAQERMGLNVPGPEDYNLLFSELRHGAKRRR